MSFFSRMESAERSILVKIRESDCLLSHLAVLVDLWVPQDLPTDASKK
jgi:hypothetical protein